MRKVAVLVVGAILIAWAMCVLAGCTLQFKATEIEAEGELVEVYQFNGVAIDAL